MSYQDFVVANNAVENLQGQLQDIKKQITQANHQRTKAKRAMKSFIVNNLIPQFNDIIDLMNSLQLAYQYRWLDGTLSIEKFQMNHVNESCISFNYESIPYIYDCGDAWYKLLGKGDYGVNEEQLEQIKAIVLNKYPNVTFKLSTSHSNQGYGTLYYFHIYLPQ